MKERIGAVQLGERTDKKFLTGLIPDKWEEKVFEHDTFWACECKRDALRSVDYLKGEKQFDRICNNIKNEFGEHLMEIYSKTSAGIHFVVYLRKSDE